MNKQNIKTEKIRDYLLGKISDNKSLEEIEDLLFSDDEFAAEVELIEDELINDYAFGRLRDEDRESFEEVLKFNDALMQKLRLTEAIKVSAKVKIAEVEKEEKTGFFDSISAYFRQPLYAGAFGALLITVLVSAFYFLMPQESTELASLKEIYENERPTESRVTQFDYAPFSKERGEQTNENNKNKLRLIENRLLEAVENNPTAENRHALGVFYLTQKKFQDSIRELKKAAELDEKNTGIRNDLGSAYFEFAKSERSEQNLKNLTNANEEFSNAIEINENFIEAIFNKALVLEELNLPKQAKETWQFYLQKDSTSKWAEEARKKLENLDQSRVSGKTREQVLEGFLQSYLSGDFQKAMQIHNETKGTFKEVSIPFLLTNRYLKAKREPDPQKASESLEALKYVGDVEKQKHSDFFVFELARIYEKVDGERINSLLIAQNDLTEGLSLVKQSNYLESIEKFEQSRKKFLENGNYVEAEVAEIWAAQMLPDVGKIEESRIRLKNLIENAEKRKFKVLIPTAYYWLGVGDFRQERFSESIKKNKKALKFAEQTENFFEVQHNAVTIAEVYKFLGEISSALEFLGKARFDFQNFYSSPAQTTRELWRFADLNEQLGNNSTSIDFAKESLKFSQIHLSETEAVNNSLQHLTDALKRKKKFKEALKYAVRSNQIALQREQSPENLRFIAETYLLLADLQSNTQNCEEALVNYDKSYEYYKKLPEIKFYSYDVYRGKMLCFRQLKRQVEFQNELKKILDISEQYRRSIREDENRQTFFENEQIVFDAAISDALERSDSKKAFEYAEMSKSRSLLDFIRSEESISEIEKKDSTVTQPLSIEEIKARMPENVQIVMYSLLEDKLAIWTLSKNNFDLKEKNINTSKFEKNVETFRRSIVEKSNDPKQKEFARDLYQFLIPTELNKEKIICFILDKSLHKIPFASLISPQGKYLIEDFSLFYSPSASVFVTASENAEKRSKVRNERLLSIGNPQFDRTENPNLEDLPNAEIEAEKISENYQTTNKFIGRSATKKSFLDQVDKAEVIHFAGHFVANGQSSRNSKLIFSDENLHSFEFSDKKLPDSKLVILSACETAYERSNKSEGMIGIGRTFLALGTPVVVASGWKVDSESTKDLMISFHQNRRRKGLSSIEAIRRAQLEILKHPDKNLPYYWAAFSAIGGFSDY